MRRVAEAAVDPIARLRADPARALAGATAHDDPERRARIAAALAAAGLDGLVCARPRNVLLLSGYWPVVGTACTVVGPNGTIVIAPADEYALAARGWADAILSFEPASLESMETPADAIAEPLLVALRRVGARHGRVGVETGIGYEPSPYVGVHSYGLRLRALVERHADLAPTPADAALAGLAAVATSRERAAIRSACRIAAHAFAEGARRLRPGMTELEAATCFRAPLCAHIVEPDVDRADGFAFCMAGPNAARAYGAFARSTTTRLAPGDLVLVHCNSYADGYWTDITRTYCLGAPDRRQRGMYDAVFAARAAALAAVRPGASAADVDAAARGTLRERGFGGAFRHSTGHGVGFAAIDHEALPRLHPCSPDVLEVGMVFNVEPGIYLNGYGGMRHCDVVAVGQSGAEILTPFHEQVDDLVLGPAWDRRA